MSDLTQSIDKQLESSRGKNIFAEDHSLFQFIQDTVKSVAEIRDTPENTKEFLINYAADKAIEEFYKVNQYYSFNAVSKRELRTIYTELFAALHVENANIEAISEQHFENLKNWLKSSNPFAEKIYSNQGGIIENVACAEYSPELQIDILKIDPNNIMQPVLDIGCGENSYLVNFLKNIGVDAYGIDRFNFNENHLDNTDWLEFDYGIEKWGCILSNLGFSNHFIHHNMREEGNYIAYGQTYMKILQSLKKGGSFHYAPSLPFIEQYLNPSQFAVKKHDIAGCEYKISIVCKLY